MDFHVLLDAKASIYLLPRYVYISWCICCQKNSCKENVLGFFFYKDFLFRLLQCISESKGCEWV